jgi:hypothetical protein
MASDPKRKRSSILKQASKKNNSRTVSFYQDGSNFLADDMDVTMMDITMMSIIDPSSPSSDNATMDMSMETMYVDNTLSPTIQGSNVSEISQLSQLSQISEIITLDDTIFGAFHDSNNLSMLSNRTSGVESLMHNIEALNECIQRVDNEAEERQRRLDLEIQNLLSFYRHIVNKDDRYEFAIAIFGLRRSLWLIIKINPDTYPNEKLSLRFAVNKKDRDLYPFKEFAEAVRRYTKEGSYGYLTRFVINAQKFRRFLKKIGYRRLNNEVDHHSKSD